MIDIHSHIIPFVDDGSVDLESSLGLIEDAIKQGVERIILTPHYRSRFRLPKEKINSEFEKFSQIVKDKGLNVNLYLGQEIFMTHGVKELLEQNAVCTLANSKYLLVEFDTANERDIVSDVYELVLLGYIPIVAHLERYFYADYKTAFEIKQVGGLIQVNADSIVRKGRIRRKVKRLFERALVDFVASDVHVGRRNYMSDSMKIVRKKFGNDAVRAVYYENARKILKG